MKSIIGALLAGLLLGPLSAQTPEWIWFRKTDGAENRYFRKSFAVQGPVTMAELVATGDDRVTVFVNGQRVLTTEEWSHPQRADVKAHLRVGRNVVALRAENGDSSPAGALAKLTIKTETGSQTLVTDATWKADDRQVPGWNQVAIDDAGWAAAETLGKVGTAPWGDVLAAAAAPLAPLAPAAPPRRQATAAAELYAARDFRVELLLSGEPEEGSWVNLCQDDRGRLLLSPQYAKTHPRGGLLRLTLGADGQIAARDFIAQPLYDAQGMVFANGALWVVVNKYSTTFESGLYRITDDGRDTWTQIKLVKKLPGGGEHGPHAVELGPDGNLWVMAGNHTKPPEGLAAHSPHRNYQEDHALPRQPDGNGHATGIMAPGGYILRVSSDATKFELFCGGFRNQYDFAFNSDNELFVFDADMEYDWGVPWYRPTRINHAVSGAEFGWRYGTGKWPDYTADSLGAVVDIGVGCPTGVGNGKGAKFPVKYQRAIYALDWTYGRLMAVHLTPDGASYRGTWENFVCPAGLMNAAQTKPTLNVTDTIIGRDGAMYFTTGGRGTAAGLYRVTYTGAESTADAWQANPNGAEARALRHRLEAFHGQPKPEAVDFVWPHLNNPDRSIRYAARIALEAQPVASWRTRALNETSAEGGLAALLALARVDDRTSQDECLKALTKWPLANLPERQQLDKLRLLQVSLARHGLPSPEVVSLGIEKLSRSYPNQSGLVNRELAQVLIALGAPDVVGKTLTIMAKTQVQEDLMHYLFHLRTAKNWTLEQRREYLGYWTADRSHYTHQGDTVKWFELAGRGYADGASFNPFRKNFLKDAVAGMSPAELETLAPTLAKIDSGEGNQKGKSKSAADRLPTPRPRTFVKAWTVAELAGEIDQASTGRSLQRGRQAFVDAQCLACHRFGSEGSGVGPELTAVGARFKRIDLLESILEPSKVVSEQFQNTMVELKDGQDVIGRLVDETPDTLVLVPNPLDPNQRATVKKSEVKAQSFSTQSPMPTSLVDSLSREELLDLIAFLESGGRADHAVYRP